MGYIENADENIEQFKNSYKSSLLEIYLEYDFINLVETKD